MKVLRLRFKNLNSLVGEWELDFTHPDYVSNGIFAIIGPTGAGKTTILDAICLALYGQTPRLNRISQSENETMSRQTGECFAEVEFETIHGRFRCHWSQHRSRRQAGGQLQAPRHEIAEAVAGDQGGQLLESRLKAVAARVEEVTGMDFDRFTRSMLLAQGGFAAFLQARPDERAPILEQITGTEIYSRISIKVHERTTEERKRLAILRAELDGIAFLSPEDEILLRAEIEAKHQEVVPLAAKLVETQAVQAWRDRMAALEMELLRLDENWIAFMARKEAVLPDLARLAGAGRALTLAGEYAQLGALRKQQQEEQDSVQGAGKRLPVLEQECRAALAAFELADASLKRAGEEQAREMEGIRKTRALDLQIGEAASRLKAIGLQIDRHRQQEETYRQSIGTCQDRMREIEVKLGETTLFLAQHQMDGDLAESLTGIEQRLKMLVAVNRQGQENQKKVTLQGAVAETARIACQQTDFDFEAATRGVLIAELHWKEVGSALAMLLQGRELAAWRTEADSLATRQNHLQALCEGLARLAEGKDRIAALQNLLESLAASQQRLAGEEKDLAEVLSRHELNCRHCEEKMLLLNRVRDLEAERTRLVDDAPCPLCGAMEHPYALGNIPSLDAGQQELQQARATVSDMRQKLESVRKGMVGAGKDLEQAVREQVELQGRLEQDTVFCIKLLADLGGDGELESWPDRVRIESERCQEKLTGLRALIAQVEGKEQEERQAHLAMTRTKEALTLLDKARIATGHGWKSAQAELERIQEETILLRQTLEQGQREVGQVLAPYGIMDVVPDKADLLLEALRVRRDAYIQRLQTQEHLRRGLVDGAGEKEKQQALLAEGQKLLTEHLSLLRQTTDQQDALVAQRQALFGSRNPDVEEKRLALVLTQAGLARDAALQEQHRLQLLLTGMQQQIQALTSSIACRAVQLAEMEPAFAMHLTELAFVNEAAFLAARLPDADVEVLRQQEARLRQEETEMNTRRRDCHTALCGEQEKNLTDQSIEQIRQENSAVAGQLSVLQQDLGALQQKIRHHEEQQQRSQARLQEIVVQKEECARWDRLHMLIGSSDGKKFRNFAQGLTFELMVAHANRQLQKMSDRYILVRDSTEPLELNVIDNYQAAEVRSTKNLSGGESFLVSLALSLGLSAMAGRTVRVDSLFLDEGFGTLDEDALEIALETLSGLQRDGKLIGIISHVPALKERIGTQIQVEAGSAGRSSLQGPGCRRLS
ncbi:MAG: AAA family ATPase [Desulfobulbaceae bacterium]|nr:AAA family ATPase [Desulfobulbaceae bacterium]